MENAFAPSATTTVRAEAVRRSAGLPGATLRRVLEHIDTNLHRLPKLTELSTVGHMSAFHFARLFKLSTGLSPHRFVVGRRIEHAKRLLAKDERSIAAISRVVGFRTPSHFATVFRRTTGATPSAYRSQADPGRVDSARIHTRRVATPPSSSMS